jgi:hypothetical protein
VKPTNVDPSLLKINRPVSGSLAITEDMLELNSIPLEFDVVGLNKRGLVFIQNHKYSG